MAPLSINHFATMSSGWSVVAGIQEFQGKKGGM